MKTKSLLADFIKVANLAGIDLSREMISLEVLEAPHVPPSSLPVGKMAVYVFSRGDECLKVGKVGPRSKARYISQHYNPASSGSNLAKSILSDNDYLHLNGISDSNVGEWIRANTSRINILFDCDIGMPVLGLLESFLQCRLKPVFEGFKSQK